MNLIELAMAKVEKLLLLSLIFVSNELAAQYKHDSAAIISLLREDYKMVADFDTLHHRRNCTYDYKLVEGGEVWNIDREIDYLAELSTSKQTRTNEFVFKSVIINTTTGYAIYDLRSVIKSEDNSIKKYHWLETAILRKVGNQWKIALIHSTQLKE